MRTLMLLSGAVALLGAAPVLAAPVTISTQPAAQSGNMNGNLNASLDSSG